SCVRALKAAAFAPYRRPERAARGARLPPPAARLPWRLERLARTREQRFQGCGVRHRIGPAGRSAARRVLQGPALPATRRPQDTASIYCVRAVALLSAYHWLSTGICRG